MLSWLSLQAWWGVVAEWIQWLGLSLLLLPWVAATSIMVYVSVPAALAEGMFCKGSWLDRAGVIVVIPATLVVLAGRDVAMIADSLARVFWCGSGDGNIRVSCPRCGYCGQADGAIYMPGRLLTEALLESLPQAILQMLVFILYSVTGSLQCVRGDCSKAGLPSLLLVMASVSLSIASLIKCLAQEQEGASEVGLSLWKHYSLSFGSAYDVGNPDRHASQPCISTPDDQTIAVHTGREVYCTAEDLSGNHERQTAVIAHAALLKAALRRKPRLVGPWGAWQLHVTDMRYDLWGRCQGRSWHQHPYGREAVPLLGRALREAVTVVEGLEHILMDNCALEQRCENR
jgi:hypothetical protein